MKSKYLSPTIKVVKFKVERGFEGSNESSAFQKNDDDFLMQFDDAGARNEAYTFDDFDWN